MPYPNLSDIVATTIANRSRTLADNLTNNNPLLYKLRQRGNVKTVSGGYAIYQEMMYNDPTTDNSGAYSGYDVIDITPDSPITAAVFPFKQYAAAVSMSGLEQLQNSGKEQMIDLLEARIKVAEARLTNKIGADIFGDGTGNNGKGITGLASALSTSPDTGTYGGIDRAAYPWWRNVAFDATVDGGAPVSPSNIQSYMNQVAVQLIRGTDKPDLIIADANYYTAYLESMQAIQRVTSQEMAGAGFTSLKYFGAGMNSDVVMGGGIGGGMPENTMYFLNTNYLFLRPHKDRNFVAIGGDRMSVNQDAFVRLIGWAGNLTSSGLQFNGVLFDSAT